MYGALVRRKEVALSASGLAMTDLHATGLGVTEDPHTNGVSQYKESNIKREL